MATRSFIGIQLPDGNVKGIYCHWDGYPQHVGRILQGHYTDPAKVEALLALGDLSALGPELGEKHDFGSNPQDQCTAYHRDRGEPLEPNEMYPSVSAAVRRAGVQWVYIFEGGLWEIHTG